MLRILIDEIDSQYATRGNRRKRLHYIEVITVLDLTVEPSVKLYEVRVLDANKNTVRSIPLEGAWPETNSTLLALRALEALASKG